MTVKNIDKDDKTVWFDPLVRLEQSVINKVPENIRLLEFFNKGLYESLIKAHGIQKPITLEEAKRNKIIDNNIQVTLNNLFPTNGILYIKGEPYAIADVQWTSSSWKIDRKIKDVPQVDVNKISDPVSFNAIVKNEIQEGNRQLQELPKNVIYGANFNKDTEELSSIDRERELLDKTRADEEARLKALADARIQAETQAKALADARLRAQAEAEAEAARLIKRPLLQIDTGPVSSTQQLALPPSLPPSTQPLALPPSLPPSTQPLALPPSLPPSIPPKKILPIENQPAPVKPMPSIKPSGEPQAEVIQNIQMSQDLVPKLVISKRSTVKARQYF